MRLLIIACILGAPVLFRVQDKPESYSVKGEEFEGCECDIYCPCIWSKDASADQCRGILAFRFNEGTYGKTDMKGVVFAVALTKSGKNLEKTLGKWEGVLYLSDKAGEDQNKAAAAILKKEFGEAFAKLETRKEPIEFKGKPGQYELSIGKIATLKISALKGSNGQVPCIKNAPSPLAFPEIYCAKADVHTYDDGTTKWDFAGRNGFYSPIEFKKP
jgi:hypothetical protein